MLPKPTSDWELKETECTAFFILAVATAPFPFPPFIEITGVSW